MRGALALPSRSQPMEARAIPGFPDSLGMFSHWPRGTMRRFKPLGRLRVLRLRPWHFLASLAQNQSGIFRVPGEQGRLCLGRLHWDFQLSSPCLISPYQPSSDHGPQIAPSSPCLYILIRESRCKTVFEAPIGPRPKREGSCRGQTAAAAERGQGGGHESPRKPVGAFGLHRFGNWCRGQHAAPRGPGSSKPLLFGYSQDGDWASSPYSCCHSLLWQHLP